ncbi:MAG: monovalent cation/H(+) antiporter subunit G [Alphaproteobacteria bacterium]|nr:monovalent cation/H(+) antiporter subunit G [Alphaproteobacteria bacterium]
MLEASTLSLILDGISWILISIGSLFLVVGGIGLLRLPDVYARLHAAGITDTMGASMMVLGLAFQADSVLVVIKLLLILVFMLFTSPTSTHAVAKAAQSSRIRPMTGPTGGESSKS